MREPHYKSDTKVTDEVVIRKPNGDITWKPLSDVVNDLMDKIKEKRDENEKV